MNLRPRRRDHVSDRPAVERGIDWVAVRSRQVQVGLALVASVAVAYLLEIAIVSGPGSLAQFPALPLTVAGVVALAFASILWGASQASAMLRGVFIHAVAHRWLTRHVGEDALLRAAVSTRWPRAVVMPFVPICAVDNIACAVARLAWQIVDQAATAAVASPAARGVTILVGGTPDLLVCVGAAVQPQVDADPRRILLWADNTDTSDSPFVEYELPDSEATQGARSHPDVLGGDARVGLLLVLREQAAAVARRAHRPVGGESPAHDPGAEHAAHTAQDPYGRLLADMKATHSDVCVEVVTVDQQIEESAYGYRDAIARIEEGLASLRPCSTVYVQGNVAASLMFATGVLAARRGHQVASVPFDSGHYAWGHRHSAPVLPSPFATADPLVAAPLAQAIPRQRWWRVLVVDSLLVGIGLPLLGGAIAMLMEWVLAGSQGQLDRGDWVAALAAVMAASGMLWGRRMTTRRLDRPALRMARDAGSDGLHERALPIPGHIADGEPRALAEWVTARFCDVVTVLPAVADVTVDLTGCPGADVAINHQGFGLYKSLRGNRPPTLLPGAPIDAAAHPGTDGA